VREFHEETGLKKSQYKIIPDVHRDICISDRGVRYRSRYYIAIAREHLSVPSGFSNSQIEEISECRWVNLNEIRLLDLDGTLLPLCRSILNCAKKRK
jgi:8-oxo-dGTP pyrophosphatase MutT (NUDIX family)